MSEVTVSPWADGWPLTAILPNLMCGGSVETTPFVLRKVQGFRARDLKLMAQPLSACPRLVRGVRQLTDTMLVFPAQAGIHKKVPATTWIPASAGMTGKALWTKGVTL